MGLWVPGNGLGLGGRVSSPLNAAESALFEAVGMSTTGYRVILRRPLTLVLGRRAYLPGVAAGVLTLAVSYRQGFAAVPAAAIAAALMILTLVAHEQGHLLFGRRAKGLGPGIVVLRSTGGMSVVKGGFETPREAALFAAGGPLVTALITVCLVVVGVQLPAPFGSALLVPGLLIALVLVANLLPLAPMDGYMLFRAAVWAGVGSRAEAERRALGWSRALLAAGALGSLVVLEHDPLDGLAALFLVGTFALQHHAAASRAAHARVPPSRNA